MIRKIGFSVFAAAACFAPLLAPTPAQAQLWTWSKEQMLEYTKAWTGDRFPDGRPKVPDALLERAKDLSSEELNSINYGVAGAGPGGAPAGGRGGAQAGPGGAAAGRGAQGGPGAAGAGRGPQGGPGAAAAGRGPQGGPGAAAAGRGGVPGGGMPRGGVAPATSGITGGYTQYTDGWEVLHPGKKMVGRVVTMQFMPVRPDLDAVVNAKAREKGVTLNNQYVLDMLQPGDVLVVDLMGKKEGGTVVGDNLFYYVNRATKGGGLVVNGAVRDLEGIAGIDMPAYYKDVHPSYLTGVTLSAVNVPVTIGNVVVMPGDIAFGDREGVTFVPPQSLERLLTAADTTHIHDEWTRKKFDEGKYKSSEIYSSPRDPALREEYQQYLKKRLEELRNGKK